MKDELDNSRLSSMKIPDTKTSDVNPILNEIKKYDIFDFLNRVSALNLIPCNQNKSIVLDFLIDAILGSDLSTYNGTCVMSCSKFKRIIDSIMGLNISLGIDPIDMPFIQRMKFFGNKWVFNGVTPNCTYIFQNLIDVLVFQKDGFNSAFLSKAKSIIDCVLKISTMIAEKCGFSLDSLAHYEEASIQYLDSQKMRALSETLIFSEDTFNDFVLKNICCDIYAYEKARADYNYCFYYAPFVKNNNGHLVLLNPTILIPFAINKILVWAQECGDYDGLINKYNEKLFFETKQSLIKLGHKEIREWDCGFELERTSSYKEALFSASSNDGVLFVRFYCDNGQDYSDKNLFTNSSVINSSPRDRFQQLLNCDQIIDKDMVYVINILSGFGRGVPFSLQKGDSIHNACFSPFELACIAINEENHPNFLFHYLRDKQKVKLVEMPFSVDLNLLTLYVENGYSFYFSDDCNLCTTNMFPGFGDSVDYLIKAIKKEDRQLVKIPGRNYYEEIVLKDAKRKIYCSIKKDEFLFINVFSRIKICTLFDTPKSTNEINIKYSIVDLISYWLGECKDLFDQNHFTKDCVLIKNILDGDPDRYYIENGCTSSPLKDLLLIEKEADDIWVLHWTSAVYQKFAPNDNLEEKELTRLLIELLSGLSVRQIDVHLLDKVFSNPLKAKMIALNVSKHPYFKPLLGKIRRIPTEWEQYLLDEIGAYLVKEKGYSYGVLPFESNNEVCNKIVDYLFSQLQIGVARFRSDELYELLYNELETIIYSLMSGQHRYAYDLACYPEQSQIIDENFNELNKASSATKFLLEYVVAIPPKGDAPMQESDYEYYLTICSQIIEWANISDLFRYRIISSRLEILQSGRIGFKKDQTDKLAYLNYNARKKRLNQASNPYVDVYSFNKLNLDYKRLDDVFVEEFGFSFVDLYLCVKTLITMGDEVESNVKRFSKKTVIERLTEEIEISGERVQKILSNLSLTQRDNFLEPSSPYNLNDVLPWKFNRRLSFIRRPISQVNDDLIWGNRQLYHSFLFLYDQILNSKIRVNNIKFKAFLGELVDQRGNSFNDTVAEKIKEIASFVVYKKVKRVNGKRIENDTKQDLGDIDVLVLIPEQKKIVVVEVKDFSVAKTPYELHQEYLRMFCDEKGKLCYISKHKKRVAWIKEHIDDILLQYSLPEGKWKVRDALIVDEPIISNELFQKGQQILLYSDISKKAFLGL